MCYYCGSLFSAIYNRCHAVKVKYDPPYLSIEAENESLENVLLKVTEQAGGKVTGPQSVFHEWINFEGESNDVRKLLWELLRQHNSTVSWSGDGKHVLEIRLLTAGSTRPLFQGRIMLSTKTPQIRSSCRM